MKVLDLDAKTYEFFLGYKKYFYTPNNIDKIYYLESIKNFDEKKFDKEKLLNIFKNLLRKENKVKLLNYEDTFGLFHFFNSIFL